MPASGADGKKNEITRSFVGGSAHFHGRIMVVGHNLRAVCTRSCALLPPPPAARTNGANGRPVSDLRKQLDDPLRQSAICILEVDAAIAQARGSEPENFGRSDRASKRQQFLRNRLGTGQQ
jgi:hypothetical protein